MKSFSPARARRTGWLASLFLALAAGSAFAAGDPPPDPALPFIQHVVIGVAPCDTCAPRTCLGDPVQISISGQLPPCVEFRGMHEQPTVGLFPLVVAEFVVDTCRVACPDLIRPFSGGTSLPPQPGGWNSVVVRVAVRTCPDTTTVVDSSQVTVDYLVRTDCASPPPSPDSLVRTFVKLAISPEHPCAGDSVTLQLVKNGCPPCVRLVSFGPGAADSLEGVFAWAPLCMQAGCLPETLSTPLGRLAQGSFHVNVAMTARVLGTAKPDSAIGFVLSHDFQVGPPGCVTPPGPCVVREMTSSVPAPQCALTLPPGGSGDVPLYYESALSMAGVQGVIEVPSFFQLTDLRLASGLTGVHLSRQRTAGGFSWLVFTDPGVTLAPGPHQHLLDATVSAFPAAPGGSSALMSATITLAAGADGRELPLCIRESFAVVAVRLCVSGDGSACDVNHDGRLDVRDLVRMAGCLRHDVVDTTGACVDCDSSGVFDINDIFCCARVILRGPPVPPDSVRQDGNVSVAFGPVWSEGVNRVVHVRVTGANALGASLLTLDYPADRWRAGIPVRLDNTTHPVDADFYPIVDVDDPGRVHLGALRLGDTGSNLLEFDVAMESTAPAQAGDQLATVGADLAARNGSVITPRDPLPALSLTAPAPPEPGPGQPQTLALSDPRPNPFTDQTTFVVSLPSSAQLDLAVHDLAGRRIATLASGLYASGQQAFHWDGAGARGGMYYVRLRVNGQVFTSRVVLLRNSH